MVEPLSSISFGSSRTRSPGRSSRLLSTTRNGCCFGGLLVGYLRWLDIHAASRAGQRQGHLALGELDVVSPGRIAGSHRDGSADWFGISFGRHLVHPDL